LPVFLLCRSSQSHSVRYFHRPRSTPAPKCLRAQPCCSPPAISDSLYVDQANCTTAAAQFLDGVLGPNATGETTYSQAKPCIPTIAEFRKTSSGIHIASAHIYHISLFFRAGTVSPQLLPRRPPHCAALQLNTVRRKHSHYRYQPQCSPAPTTSAVAEAAATIKADAATHASPSICNPSAATAPPPCHPSAAGKGPRTQR
jgi:hypothetical protein